MKEITAYITEKLKINKDSQSLSIGEKLANKLLDIIDINNDKLKTTIHKYIDDLKISRDIQLWIYEKDESKIKTDLPYLTYKYNDMKGVIKAIEENGKIIYEDRGDIIFTVYERKDSYELLIREFKYTGAILLLLYKKES